MKINRSVWNTSHRKHHLREVNDIQATAIAMRESVWDEWVNDKASDEEMAVMNLFVVKSWCAMEKNRVARLASHLDEINEGGEKIVKSPDMPKWGKALTALVRKGYMRSYRKNGTRFYELGYHVD